MFDKFNFYDLLGYLIPGAIATLALYWLGTAVLGLTVLPSLQTDLGSSLVFIGVSYVLGHAMQAVGDWWEEQFNRRQGGRYSERLLLPSGADNQVPAGYRLSPQLKKHVIKLATSVLTLSPQPKKQDAGTDPAKKWRQELFDQCYALIVLEDCVQRTDVFLAINGLSRGLYIASGIGLVTGVAIVLKQLVLQPHPNTQLVTLGLVGISAALVVGWLMRQVFQRYRRYFANSVYYNFAAWCAKERYTKK